MFQHAVYTISEVILNEQVREVLEIMDIKTCPIRNKLQMVI